MSFLDAKGYGKLNKIIECYNGTNVQHPMRMKYKYIDDTHII